MYTAVPCHVLCIYLIVYEHLTTTVLSKKEGLVRVCGDSSLTKNSED